MECILELDPTLAIQRVEFPVSVFTPVTPRNTMDDYEEQITIRLPSGTFHIWHPPKAKGISWYSASAEELVTDGVVQCDWPRQDPKPDQYEIAPYPHNMALCTSPPPCFVFKASRINLPTRERFEEATNFIPEPSRTPGMSNSPQPILA